MTEQTHKNDMLSRTASSHELALWGLQDVAYVKRVTVNDEIGWAIHSADGANIGMALDREVAFAAVRQHDLEPVSVH